MSQDISQSQQNLFSGGDNSNTARLNSSAQRTTSQLAVHQTIIVNPAYIEKFFMVDDVLNSLQLNEGNFNLGRVKNGKIFNDFKNIKWLQITPGSQIDPAYDRYRILVRECFKGIFKDILKNICRSRKEEKKVIIDGTKFIPQCCFLIYGNQYIGKTALCYYLAYMFSKSRNFFNSDIIVKYKIRDDRPVCLVRCALNEENDSNIFVNKTNKIPTKQHPTIVISDNAEINEDDFSEDDVVIMISSPCASQYKIFLNKRQPIQYTIPPLEGNELKEVLYLLLGHFNNFEGATKFGGDLITAYSYRFNIENYNVKFRDVEFRNVKFRNVKLYDCMPGSYNESVFIYDTYKFNDIPRRLKFLSKEIENSYFELNYIDPVLCKKLFDAFDLDDDGILFECLIHALLGIDGYESTQDMRIRNFRCKSDKIIVDGKRFDLNVILKAEISFTQYYVKFSIVTSFPAIDGCFIDENAIYGIQITIKIDHNTKNNVIVFFTMLFNIHKFRIIRRLINRYVFYNLRGTEDDLFYKSLYNFGYMPDNTKCRFIYSRIVENWNKSCTYDTVMNEVVLNIKNKSYNNILLEYIKKIVKFEFYYIINEVDARNLKKIIYKADITPVEAIYNDFLDENIIIKKSKDDSQNNEAIRDKKKKRKNSRKGKTVRKKARKEVNNNLNNDIFDDDDDDSDSDYEAESSSQTREAENNKSIIFKGKEGYIDVYELDENLILLLIQFNKDTRSRLNNNIQFLNDLNDYLLDISYYIDKTDINYDPNINYNQAIADIKNEINSHNYETVINRLNYCNPPFHIFFFTYKNQKIRSQLEDSSVNFDHYDIYINQMKGTMRNIYKNWDLQSFSDDKKKQIINRRCKRLRFETKSVYYSQLNNIKDERNTKQLIRDFDTFLIEKYRVVSLNKSEENINNNANDVSEEEIENIIFESGNITTVNGSRNEVNSIKHIFDQNRLPQMEQKECSDTERNVSLIKINYHVYQYPMNRVYVRESYKTLWNLFEKTLTDKKANKKIPYIFLLRGNPGLGKTSFVIYLLYKFLDKSDDNIIMFYKNVNKKEKMYRLYSDGLREVNNLDDIKGPKVDVVISDSYNFESDGKEHNLVIYISSPDQRSYSFYNKNPLTSYKKELYFDVFSQIEIEEWMKYCLPDCLTTYINENQLVERYGKVPRHIYYAALYGYYFGRNYWNEIYCRGINTVVSNIGFKDFIKNYLLTQNSEWKINQPKEEEKREIKEEEKATVVFDITLCHYIVKYLIDENNNNDKDDYGDNESDIVMIEIKKKLVKVSKLEMGFISNDVIVYIFNSIHHLTDVEDLEWMVGQFYDWKDATKNILLYRLLFQEIVWCKCSFYVDHLQIPGNGIIPLEYDVYEDKFKILFRSAIYVTYMKGIYILPFLSLKNGDMIYLLNNCFIHVSIDYSLIIDDYDKGYINQCIGKLRDVGFNDFYFVSIYPDNKRRISDNVSSKATCYLKDCQRKISTELNIQFYYTVLDKEKYNKEFQLYSYQL